MHITFLGTGTSLGVPMVACSCGACSSTDARDSRLRSSVLIRTDGLSILVDAGPDFRQQMLRHAVQHLDAILITHEHKDHIGGLDDVRGLNRAMHQAMPLYGEERALAAIRREFHYAFRAVPIPGAPQFILHTIAEEPFNIGGARVVPVRGMHAQLPVLGYRIGGFAYITDMNSISSNSIELIRQCRVLAISAVQRDPHDSHFALGEALAVIQEAKPERAYLTHISHRLGRYGSIAQGLPPNVMPAYDGLVLEI